MAKIQVTKNFPGKSSQDVYQAVLKGVPNAGFVVWKRRDIAWLVMVKCGDTIDGNVSVRGSQVTVALTSAADADLQAKAEAIFAESGKILA
jgi:hypothetical protein